MSFLLISIDHRHHHLASLRSALSVVVYPIQYLVGLPLTMGNRLVENLSTRNHLIDENRRLREENLLLRSRTQKYAALEKENLRLRELRDSSPSLGEHVVIADVIAVELTSSARQFIVNKGTRHDVFVGQPLLDAYGVLGQVVQVGPFSSTALLITDIRHAVPVRINRSGVRAIAVGTQNNETLELTFVGTNADVIVGDLVVTSGLGQRFPQGYPVGEVTKVFFEAGASFATVLVTPNARIGQAREVLLVWPQKQPESARLSSDVISSLEQEIP